MSTQLFILKIKRTRYLDLKIGKSNYEFDIIKDKNYNLTLFLLFFL